MGEAVPKADAFEQCRRAVATAAFAVAEFDERECDVRPCRER